MELGILLLPPPDYCIGCCEGDVLQGVIFIVVCCVDSICIRSGI